MGKKYSRELDAHVDLFELLQHGGEIYCGKCRSGIIRPMDDIFPLEKTFCFECDNCGAVYRYDPVNIIIT